MTAWLGSLGAQGATITVTSTLDGATSGDGICTLREALANANANGDNSGGDCAPGSGLDVIEFDIPANDPGHFFYLDNAVPNSVPGDPTLTAEENDADLVRADPDYPRPGQFATMPAVPLEGTGLAGAEPNPLYFAQFADGLGLFSQIILFGLSDQSTNATISLRNDPGEPLSVDLNGQVVNGSTEVVVPAEGLRRFKTDSLGALTVGAVTVSSDSPLAGVILFGGGLGLAGVGSSQALENGFSAPMETNSVEGIDTGIAVMNLESEAVTLTLTLFDENGNQIDSAQAILDPMGHRAGFLNAFDWLTDADKGTLKGVLQVTSTGRIAATVIQSRPSQFATMPVAAN